MNKPSDDEDGGPGPPSYRAENYRVCQCPDEGGDDGVDYDGGDEFYRQLLKLKADNKRLCALWEAQLQGEEENSENVGPVPIVLFTSLHIQMLCSLWRTQFHLVDLFYTAGCIHDQDQSLPQRH